MKGCEDVGPWAGRPLAQTMMKSDEVEAMLHLYALGWGLKRIAREFGCSKNTVRRYVEADGTPGSTGASSTTWPSPPTSPSCTTPGALPRAPRWRSPRRASARSWPGSPLPPARGRPGCLNGPPTCAGCIGSSRSGARPVRRWLTRAEDLPMFTAAAQVAAVERRVTGRRIRRRVRVPTALSPRSASVSHVSQYAPVGHHSYSSPRRASIR